MNIRNINITMSEYSSIKNWELLKSSCFISEKKYVFIAIIAASNGNTVTNDYQEGSIRVNNLSVDIIWKDKNNRMIWAVSARSVKKINGEDRILTCDSANWETGFDSGEIASAELIITDKKGSCWDNDDTIRWDRL